MAFSISMETSPGSGVYNDVTAELTRDTVTLKLNTLDFTLRDPATRPQIGMGVLVTDPAWAGSLASVTTYDPVDRYVGEMLVACTATNTDAMPTNTAPFDLSDSPADSTFHLLLESGDRLILEDGTDFGAGGRLLLEGALSYGYRRLAVQTHTNQDGPDTTYGRCEVVRPGLRPGDLFHLTSGNQGYSATQFQITQCTIQWTRPDTPIYGVEFGDVPSTFATWTRDAANQSVPVAPPPDRPPPSTVTAASCTATPGLKTMGGGIQTVGSASFSVSAPPGGSCTVQVLGQIDCRAYAWSNYGSKTRAVRAIISGGIYTGAWQGLPGGTSTTWGARAVYDLSSADGISLPDGTYTLSIQVDASSGNQIWVYGGWAQAAVTTS